MVVIDMTYAVPVTPTLLAVAVVAAIALTSCAPQRSRPVVAPGSGASAPAAPPAASSLAARTSEPATPGVSSSPPADAAAFRALASEAYRELARGDEAAARDAFARFAPLDRSVRSPVRAGLPSGRIVVGPMVSAHAGGFGTVFFDGGTGEAFAFSDARVHRAVAGTNHAWFWLEAPRSGIFDARAGQRLELPGDALAVNPVRPRAYVLDERCRLLEVALPGGELVRTLGTLGRRLEGTTRPLDPCDAYTYRDAAVTLDGGHLTTRVGRWNLRTGAFSPLPAAPGYHQPAVSRDGRYIARITTIAGSPARDEKIVLHDLDGAGVRVASWSYGDVVSDDPLRFESDPPRLCFAEYGHYIFHLPSLEPFAVDDPRVLPGKGSFGARDCEERFRSPAERRAEELLAARVCDVTGLPVPLRFCDGIAAP